MGSVNSPTDHIRKAASETDRLALKRHFPVFTYWIQSPWFLNVRGVLKSFQPSFLHWSLFVGGPMLGTGAHELNVVRNGLYLITPSSSIISSPVPPGLLAIVGPVELPHQL